MVKFGAIFPAKNHNLLPLPSFPDPFFWRVDYFGPVLFVGIKYILLHYIHYFHYGRLNQIQLDCPGSSAPSHERRRICPS